MCFVSDFKAQMEREDDIAYDMAMRARGVGRKAKAPEPKPEAEAKVCHRKGPACSSATKEHYNNCRHCWYYKEA
jgi:ribosomal protein S10